MEPLFIQTPSGQWISGQHIVSLDIEGSGTEDQLRHAVHARLVTGEKQLLSSFRGVDSEQEARTYLGSLLGALKAQQFSSPDIFH